MTSMQNNNYQGNNYSTQLQIFNRVEAICPQMRKPGMNNLNKIINNKYNSVQSSYVFIILFVTNIVYIAVSKFQSSETKHQGCCSTVLCTYFTESQHVVS